jgi:hypothetical protein
MTSDAMSGNTDSAGSILTDYDQYHHTLLSTNEYNTWEAELRCYLKDLPADVSAETDIVEWWQVCLVIFVLTVLVSDFLCRITATFILHSHELHWMSSLSLPPLSHVSISFQQQRRLRMIVDHFLGPRDLNNYKS